MEGKQIVAAARSYIGVRYFHAGRNRFGLDCVGLPIVVGLDLGILPDGFATPGYGRTVNTEDMRRRIEFWCEPVSISQMREGDILLMRVRRSPQHLAILSSVSPLSIIHACTSLKSVAEQLLDDSMRDSIEAVFRFREAQ